MSIITIGIDLAKNVFAVHGVNENGHAELVKPKVSREQLLPLIANLPPHHRHGSLLRRTPLGTSVSGAALRVTALRVTSCIMILYFPYSKYIS